MVAFLHCLQHENIGVEHGYIKICRPRGAMLAALWYCVMSVCAVDGGWASWSNAMELKQYLFLLIQNAFPFASLSTSSSCVAARAGLIGPSKVFP